MWQCLIWILCGAAQADDDWWVTSGTCRIDSDGCATSPRYPSRYTNNRDCEIEVAAGNTKAIMVAHFSTEARYDFLEVNDISFSGQIGPENVVPEGVIKWTSDYSVTNTGWRLCLQEVGVAMKFDARCGLSGVGLALAATLQGCDSPGMLDLPKLDSLAISMPDKWFGVHSVPYWRQQPDYWTHEAYAHDEHGNRHAEKSFNSCMNPKLHIENVCSGHGSCVPFGDDTGLSFCKCYPGYGGMECNSKRLSQTTAWFLALFLGPAGADQYYLGWYPQMLMTQVTSVLGLLLLAAISSSRLPGLCVFMAPWMYHVVVIGSAPAQAVRDRTAADLPRCAFVSFSLLWMGFLSLAICIYDVKYKTQVKRIMQDQFRNYSSAKIIA
ncbi:unnamed protein product [Symbiodinium natans]|uniref:EGF-like domain-containing protein n=1 Tax=Symbiodinium natans TaxID=878477 RepID=A0A812IJR5_9DINO|nr:unnamed protein product [Symbiodinium natans]